MNQKNNKVYIIAEAGINHNGNIDNAIDMIIAAKNIGADCIKFQAFQIDKLVSDKAASATYQKKETGKNKQKEFLRDLVLTKEDFKLLYEKCKELKIDFLCTAFDEDLLLYLAKLGMKAVKIPSGEITNFPYLNFVAKLSLPVILSTGMSNLSEVKLAIKFLLNKNSKLDITILHCTSIYPAPHKTLNLLAIDTLLKEFNIKVGYSDHSKGNTSSIAAIGIGARLIEKHFTLNKDFSGPDQKASADVEEFSSLIKEIRILENALRAIQSRDNQHDSSFASPAASCVLSIKRSN